MEKVQPKDSPPPSRPGTQENKHESGEDEVLPPLQIMQSTMAAAPPPRQKRISFNLWPKSEVIPAVNRVSLAVSAEERKKLDEGLDLQSVKFMLDPESKPRLSWDALIALTTVFLAWRLPYSLAFESDQEFVEQAWSVAFNNFSAVIYILDVVANFRTGFRNDIELVMDPKKVAMNYCRSWFFIDVAGSIPFEVFVKNSSGIERKAVKTTLKYLKIPRLFRLARVIRFVRKHMQFMYSLQLSVVYISICHWVACLGPTLFPEGISMPDPFTRYGYYAYIAVTAMLNLGRIDEAPPENQLTLAVLSVFGFFLLCLVGSSITAIFVSKSSRASEYQDKIRAVMSDLKALQVPRELRQAAKNYYEMLWRVKKTSDRYEKFIYEDQDLSPTIRAEIALHIHRRAIAVVPLFKGCTDDCLASVVMRLRTHLYMAHDVIFHKGEPGRSMLIIIRGKVKIIGADNRTLVAVLKEGSFFGEIGLLQNTTRSCTVIAATFCEMKSLDQGDAEVIFSLYPHILERLYRESDRRKRDNSNRSSFNSIRVLDNAHNVEKDMIDHVSDPGGFNRSFRDAPTHLHAKVEKQSSLIRNLDTSQQGWTDATSPMVPPDVTSRTMETLSNLRLDVDDLKDMLTTILENQKVLVEKITEMEVRSHSNHHVHRRRTKEMGEKKPDGSMKHRELLRMAGESDRSMKIGGSNDTEEEPHHVVNRLMSEEIKPTGDDPM
ncbi:Aste57867_12219 [Aphanomyces stellatus]|uniref:Aste57867_12219 protein n=1 Tax=Aphanomyces stellatus TaxID=120398 RepID=A0A485KWC9_9STRA|nr:hypothetical protein As57867_012174 [Aphanomyces stellatus]VFT89073.1 Aste57867_12219 [Aphanomyces stellatus]